MDVAVLGGGPLARRLAEACVLADYAVRLHSAEVTEAMDAIDAVERSLDGAAGDQSADRLEATTDLEAAVSGVDVVVETVSGGAGRLQERLAAIEEFLGRKTVVAQTAPRVSVTAAAAGLRHPDRAVGLRLPDELDSPLVEVVIADQTTGEHSDRAQAFVAGLDRTPVLVGDGPGAVSTRAVLALEAEAMRLLEQGIAGVEEVDEAVGLGYGHATGPLEQADRAGLGNRLETFEYLHAELGDRFEPPTVLRERVATGTTGMASGEGFYCWEDGEPTEPALAGPDLPRGSHAPDDPASG